MAIIGGKPATEFVRSTRPGTSQGEPERDQALDAFKQGIDALFEAESAERASPAVRRLFAIVHRPPLRLATLRGFVLPACLAASRYAAASFLDPRALGPAPASAPRFLAIPRSAVGPAFRPERGTLSGQGFASFRSRARASGHDDGRVGLVGTAF